MPSSAYVDFKARLQARIEAQEHLVDLLSDKADRLVEANPQYQNCLRILSLANDHLDVLKKTQSVVQWDFIGKLSVSNGLEQSMLYNRCLPSKTQTTLPQGVNNPSEAS
jgi:hypothetical protein